MENKSVVRVLRSKPKWWTVEISGKSSDETVDELIRSYQEIVRLGIRRVCLDLSQNNSEFTLVNQRTPDVLQVASGFQRVAVLVGDAKTAFVVKASTKGESDRFRVFYSAEDLNRWLDE